MCFCTSEPQLTSTLRKRRLLPKLNAYFVNTTQATRGPVLANNGGGLLASGNVFSHADMAWNNFSSSPCRATISMPYGLPL